jgi:Replication-relaxation
MTTDTTNRLPRFRRSSTQVACVLTPRDLAILRLVESFRLLTSEHLRLLAPGSDQGILRRLQILFHAGFLDRLRPQFAEGGGSSKIVYAITNRGVKTLQKEGLIQHPSKTDWNAQNRELGDIHIAHTLLVSHIRAMLTSACSPLSNVQLLFWREGAKLQDRIEVALPDTYAKVPVAPDGFFGLRDAKGRSSFFVEADRGTMTLERFTRKLKAYAAYFRQKKHEEKFGITFFRVLTVTSSAERQRNLLSSAEAAEDLRRLKRMFLFTTEEKLSLARPETIFEKLWTVPASVEPHALFGEAPSENPTHKENITMQQDPNAHTEVRHGP